MSGKGNPSLLRRGRLRALPLVFINARPILLVVVNIPCGAPSARQPGPEVLTHRSMPRPVGFELMDGSRDANIESEVVCLTLVTKLPYDSPVGRGYDRRGGVRIVRWFVWWWIGAGVGWLGQQIGDQTISQKKTAIVFIAQDKAVGTQSVRVRVRFNC